VRGAKSFSDRMVLMRDGKIVMEGEYEEFEKSRDEFVARFMKGEEAHAA
jgi:ABC-type transporter Mla maintaining outer membrane lipid asymmetry ATPase subunit MlaF